MAANETKMIIITSNEDVIRQFSLNKTHNNTLIIDLDNEKQISSISKNNSINLSVLAQLSELNSSSDHVYKRVLNSSDNNPSKPVKIPRRSTDLICTICGDRAVGFNYDALSCASCKAFFRRNAHQPLEKLSCLTGKGQCTITYTMRRKCPRCRLNRCFTMGMRKDFILSEEEKERRKKRLEENRKISSNRLSISESENFLSPINSLSNSEYSSQTFDELDYLLMDTDKFDDNILINENIDLNQMKEFSLEMLTLQDQLTIEHVQKSFISYFQNEDLLCFPIDVKDHGDAIISWSQSANQIALRFISFFRQIDEFESLNDDDRFILIKYNLLPLFPIFKCFIYKPMNYICSKEDNDKYQQWLISSNQSNDIRHSFIKLILSLVETTEQDPVLLSLLLPILIFSHGLSMNENEPPLKDSLAVNRAQNYYIQLLWKYWIDRCGEIKAWKHFSQLLTIIFQIQSATKQFRDFLHYQYMTSNTIEKLAPLMQTVLHVS
ncbi:unnamed protein product [Rotaria sordida]|uniref:Uncharacterized protein n=1 Tax=Rotaria sordida TaxID=392033 RepID=A0A819MK27_9BILA|nr:unnamed protein product [Rotaria sordida]CAF3980611.1 unnamed protein product [Rotaria sordida]